MVRLQIQLESGQHRQVRRRAKRLGVSVSEVIRRCIDAGLGDEATNGFDARGHRALAAAGRHLDPQGTGRAAAEHDAALADAYKA